MSKVVDANGEPRVVYHGTRGGGFAAFDISMRSMIRPKAAFAAGTRRTAASYSGSESEIDLYAEADEWKVVRNAGGRFGIVDGYGKPIDYISDTSYATEQAAKDELQAIRDDQEVDYDKKRGIYPVFLNIRNPIEEAMEGANWDGTNEGWFGCDSN